MASSVPSRSGSSSAGKPHPSAVLSAGVAATPLTDAHTTCPHQTRLCSWTTTVQVPFQRNMVSVRAGTATPSITWNPAVLSLPPTTSVSCVTKLGTVPTSAPVTLLRGFHLPLLLPVLRLVLLHQLPPHHPVRERLPVPIRRRVVLAPSSLNTPPGQTSTTRPETQWPLTI